MTWVILVKDRKRTEKIEIHNWCRVMRRKKTMDRKAIKVMYKYVESKTFIRQKNNTCRQEQDYLWP